MKETNIPFCTLVPDNWSIIPNRYLFQCHSTKVGSKARDYQLLSLTTTGVKEKDINSSGGKVPENYDNYQTVSVGDMIFCLFDLDCSAVFSGLSPYSGMITSAYDVLRANSEKVDSQYIDYWFKYVFSNRYYKMYSKSIRYTITGDMFKAIETPLPPLEEQIRIRKFLKEKCSAIDELIENENKQIEKLKEYRFSLFKKILNDDCLFDGFKLKKRKFKTMATLCNGKEIGKDGGSIPVYGSGGVFKYTDTSLMNGESLLMGRKGTIDKPMLVNGEFWTVDTMFYTSEFKDCVGEYLYYLCTYCIDYGYFKSGSVLPSMTQTDINNVCFNIAPIEYQQRIANLLNKKNHEINELIGVKSTKIKQLEEYKKSLIFEYVTGKKEVI